MNKTRSGFVTGTEPTFYSMKTSLVLASLVAAVSGLAGLATTANAGTDFSINLNIGSRRPVVVVEDHSHRHGHRHHAPSGYWKEVTVKAWVPAHWAITRDHCHREVRTLVPGRYTYRTDRVWIDTSHGNHGGHSHRGHYSHGRGR